MADAPSSNAPTFNFKQAITQMVQRNASDLLLKVGRPATIRVNGELAALNTAPLKPEELKSLAEQIMTPRQVKEFAEHKEADFAIGVPGVGRLRTNVYQQRGTVAFAFRAIAYEVKTIRDLNLPGVLEELVLRPRGLVLVTGVTGSAKSTALAVRSVPRKAGEGRVPGAGGLINTAAFQEGIRDLSRCLGVPHLLAKGSLQYGMQGCDQSLLYWYQQGAISYESAIFYATNPSEFALKVSGVDSGESQSFGGATTAAGLRGDITP